jgi:hypothetical protein
MYHYTCLICNKQFTGFTKNRATCSMSCRSELQHRRAPGKLQHSKVCVVCNIPFTTIDKRAVCCSATCASKKGHLQHGVPFSKRLWANIDKSGGSDACWPWVGKVKVNGYGRLKDKGKSILAHRAAYELTNGKIPDGMFVCHKCDNPPCCNPAHHFLGAPVDNSNDKVSKNRHARGENTRKSKLTDQQVLEIRTLNAAGTYTKVALAKMFGVNRSYIQQLVKGVYRKL